jgi:hypothetical protein
MAVYAWRRDLYIETKNIILDDDYVKPFYAAPGNYVKISVTDTALGWMRIQTEDI